MARLIACVDVWASCAIRTPGAVDPAMDTHSDKSPDQAAMPCSTGQQRTAPDPVAEQIFSERICMSDKNIRRVVGGLSAFAVAAGFAVTMGVGAASAAPGTVQWNDGNSKFSRTVSNTTPNEGEIITISTTFERKAWTSVEWIQAVKDLHPTCLTYVSGSPAAGEVKPDYAKVTGAWDVYPNIQPKSRTFNFQYKVGADCARGTTLPTGMHYSGSLGQGQYTDKGPSITVSKNITSTTLATVGGAQVGVASELSATVTGGAQGDPVDFYDGATKIGSGSLDAAGKATVSWNPSVKGSHTLQAKFADTARAKASESATQTISVEQQNVTSTTVLTPVNGAQVGLASTLEATVSPAAGGGAVEFKDGDNVLATVPVNGSGKAVYPWAPTTAGSHGITATFSGRDGVNGSAATATVVVADKPISNIDSTTTIADVAGAQVGKVQTVNARVTGATTGTVTFKVGDTVIGTATVDGNGNASISWTPAAAGQFIVTAQYSGAGNVNASDDSVSVIVAASGTGGGDNGGGDNGGGIGSLGSLTGIAGF